MTKPKWQKINDEQYPFDEVYEEVYG